MTVQFTKEEVERILFWAPAIEELRDYEIRIVHRMRSALQGMSANGRWQHADEFRQAWDSHHKRDKYGLDLVLQSVITKSELIDWNRFADNHPPYCDYWDRHGWQYCPETLLSWIENGMQPPPPEPQRQTRQSRIANRK